MINHIITGYALPSLPVAIKIAKSLEVTVDDIFVIREKKYFL